jgi:DNA-binding NtrC family response regulator
MSRSRILVVDDDESLRWITQLQLEEAGYAVSSAQDAERALSMIEEESPSLVITDLRMPGLSGLDLLRGIRAEHPETFVVVITAFGTVQNAVEAMKSGAYDYITKPIDHEELLLVVNRALEHQKLVEEVRTLRTTLDAKYGFESIIGRSQALLRLLEISARVAARDSTVLIRGETGTGKELLARAIHFNSRRKQQPFVTINCGAIPKDLLESELFGHTKGSFTGATAPKMGKVEAADGGTLFLDEIGEMPVELQVKLLRLIQNGEIEKVGATAPTKVDVRIIAATHRNLQALIEDGAFREDLYYRLAVIPLELPPLRDRSEDVPELVEHLFLKARQKHELPRLKLPAALIPYFCAYRWPGNVRELENVVERLVVLAVGDEITFSDLPDFLRCQAPGQEAIQFDLPPQGISLEGVERELLLRALQKFDWNQTQAARYLDISRRTLIYRMEKHDLRKDGPPVADGVPTAGGQKPRRPDAGSRD